MMYTTTNQDDARREFDLSGGYLLILGLPGFCGSSDYCYGGASREEALDLGRDAAHLDALAKNVLPYAETKGKES